MRLSRFFFARSRGESRGSWSPGGAAHNARCAFVAGMAMAAGAHTLMLQETLAPQPIDYRDVIKSYSDAAKVSDILVPLIRGVVETLQESRFVPVALPLKPLEKIDLGDLAAENEIKALSAYFVPPESTTK